MVDVFVVVMRWFGGTKLGTGGLIRAYGEAAAAALAEAEVVEHRLCDTLTLQVPYALTGAVQSAMAAHEAELLDAVYDAAVTMTVSVPVEHTDLLVHEIRERTSGKVQPQ